MSLTTTATDDEDGHGEDEEEEEEEDENERTSTSKSGGGGSEKGGEPKKKGKSTKAKWKKIKNAVGVSKEVTSATMRRAQLRIGILEKQPQERTREEVLVLEELMLRIKFLEQLARPSRLEICRVASYKQLETGNVLFQQGDAGDAFYIVLSGSVSVSVRDPNTGIEMVVASCMTGQCFGELALQDPSSKRAATVATREPTEFLVVYSEDYNRILKHLISDELNEKLNFLLHVPVFRDVPTQNMQALASVLTTRTFTRGKVIAKQGSESDELFLIKRGCCRLVKEVKLDKRGHKEVCTLRRQVLGGGLNTLCDNLRLPPISGDPLYFEQPHRKVQARLRRVEKEASVASLNSPARTSFGAGLLATPRADRGDGDADVDGGGEAASAVPSRVPSFSEAAESSSRHVPTFVSTGFPQGDNTGSLTDRTTGRSTNRRRPSNLPTLPSALSKDVSYVSDTKGDPWLEHEISFATPGRKPRVFLELGLLRMHDYFGEVGHGNRSFRSSSVVADGIVECYVLNKWDFQRRLTEETVSIINQNMMAYKDDEEIRREFSRSVKWLRYKQRILRETTVDFKGEKRRQAFSSLMK